MSDDSAAAWDEPAYNRTQVDRITARAFLKALGGDTYKGRFEALLRLNRGRVVHVEEAIDYCWGDREDGGPDSAQNEIEVMVCRLRGKRRRSRAKHARMNDLNQNIFLMRTAGASITTHWGRGWVLD